MSGASARGHRSLLDCFRQKPKDLSAVHSRFDPAPSSRSTQGSSLPLASGSYDLNFNAAPSYRSTQASHRPVSSGASICVNTDRMFEICRNAQEPSASRHQTPRSTIGSCGSSTINAARRESEPFPSRQNSQETTKEERRSSLTTRQNSKESTKEERRSSLMTRQNSKESTKEERRSSLTTRQNSKESTKEERRSSLMTPRNRERAVSFSKPSVESNIMESKIMELGRAAGVDAPVIGTGTLLDPLPSWPSFPEPDALSRLSLMSSPDLLPPRSESFRLVRPETPLKIHSLPMSARGSKKATIGATFFPECIQGF